MAGLDDITALAFALRASPGAYALLVGSGVSSSADIPTGWDIVLDLIRRVSCVERADAGDDLTGWYVRTFGEDPTYANVIGTVARTAAERQALLRSYIEPTDEQRQRGTRVPTAAHRAIAELVERGYIRIILTTNFDRLIEQALEERGVAVDVIPSVDALRGARPIGQSLAVLVKLHGDYRDARIRNTPSELGSYEPEIDAILDRILDEHGLVVCGWSATWDDALRSAILRQPGRRFTTFWSARSSPTAEAKELIQARGAVLIQGHDAERFFTELERKVTALEEVDRPHPLSVKTAVAELKRYIPDPQARIRLEDLVHGEAERVAEASAASKFPAEGQPGSVDEARRRVARYEAATEILVAILTAGCSHSDGPAQDRIWSGAIERVAETPRIESGLVAYIALRRYPGLVCLYAGGLAAFAAERWTTLHELWFGRMTRDSNGRAVPLLAGLSVYSAFPDLNPQAVLHPTHTGGRMYTPISDHLHGLLREPVRPLLPSDERYTAAFDRYELLASMALIDLHASWNDQGYIPDGFIGSFAWRFRLHSEGSPFEWATNELARHGGDWPLLQTGLFGGDSERFSSALAAAVTLAQKLPW